MKDPRIDEMVRSRIFPDDSSAAYALAMFSNLRKPISGPLIDIKGREYTVSNFPQYLEDHCNVKYGNTKKAMELLQKLSD